MTAGVPIIDLDRTAPRPEDEARPFRLRLRPPRAVLVAGVVVLALATLGAAGPPARRLVHRMSVGGTAAAAFVLGADTIYTASFGANPNSEAAVRGYRLPDGGLRWAAALPQNVQNLVVDDAAHVLMARSAADPKVTFLDTGTGEVLWRDEEVNTSFVAMVRGTVLSRTDVAATQSTLRLADARTGRQIWSATVDATASLLDMSGGGWSRVAAIGTAGTVTVLDRTDGRVLTRGDLGRALPIGSDDADADDYIAVEAVGDRLYVSQRVRGLGSLTAYSLVPLARLWRSADVPAGLVTDCGIVLCVQNGGGLTVFDPATGSVRWQLPDVWFAFRFGPGTLYTYDQEDPAGAMLRDALTGSARADFGNGVQIGGIVLRSDTKIGGRTWVLVPEGGAWRVAGSLETAAPFGCEVRHPYLACPTIAGPTVVWQLP